MNWYFIALRKYAVFNGRARRKEYWYFVLFNIIIHLFFVLLFLKLGGIDVLLESTFEEEGNNDPILIFWRIYSLLTLLPGVAVSVRRLHDANKSGWWILIGLVPLIGAIVLIVFFCMDSDSGENRYGPNPKNDSLISDNQPQLPVQHQTDDIINEPGQAHEVKQKPVSVVHNPQQISQADIPTRIDKQYKKQSVNLSRAASFRVHEQSFSVELDDNPIVLGRGSHLNLPSALKAIFAGDEYIASSEHCQVWYKAITRELYVYCLTEKGVTVDGYTLTANTKGKVDFDHPVQLILGKTTISISPR